MSVIRWTFGDASPHNLRNLGQIATWLGELKGRMVIQRLRTARFDQPIDWTSAPGDGYLHLGAVEIRGTTVYYMDLSEMKERGVMASRIELDTQVGACTIYSGRINGGVVRLQTSEEQRVISLGNASYALDGDVLVVTDRTQQLTVRMPFSELTAALFMPYFQARDALDNGGEDTFRPGERCPISGQWEILTPFYVGTDRERTVVKDEPFPPTPGEGALYRLRDATQH